MLNNIQTKKYLENHGTCLSQSSEKWSGDIKLPQEVLDFYYFVGPNDIAIESSRGTIDIPSLSNLWDMQAGYRWNANTGELISGWESDWIVIASQGGDPYIYSKGKILAAEHGCGDWTFVELYSDINTFMICSSILGSIMKTSTDFMDEDCIILPKYVKLASDKLKEIINDDKKVSEILNFEEWTI